jgi:hypothetical protein
MILPMWLSAATALLEICVYMGAAGRRFQGPRHGRISRPGPEAPFGCYQSVAGALLTMTIAGRTSRPLSV